MLGLADQLLGLDVGGGAQAGLLALGANRAVHLGRFRAGQLQVRQRTADRVGFVRIGPGHRDGLERHPLVAQ